MSTPDDVVTRLREGAHEVPRVPIDTPGVVASARRALFRRRRRQGLAGALVAGLVALTFVGPVHLPGVGTVSMPGSYQVRSGLGLQDPSTPPWPIVDLDELLGTFVTRPPSPATMAREVASLQQHVLPVVEQLRATWYEDEVCHIVEYERGMFSDDGACGGRPGERPFDDTARADLDRILEAVERSGVRTHELLRATYTEDGSPETVAFDRPGGGIGWNFAYVYSPGGKPEEWSSALGPVTVTPIGTSGWWFEKSPDD